MGHIRIGGSSPVGATYGAEDILTSFDGTTSYYLTDEDGNILVSV